MKSVTLFIYLLCSLKFVFSQDHFLEVEFKFKSSKTKQVSIAGSFNNWDPETHLMNKQGDEWKLKIRLPDGYYYYKFIVDEKWISDPKNDWKINDGGKGFNSILKVGQPPRPKRNKNDRPFPKNKLPKPILGSNPEYVDLYYATWQMAWNKISKGTAKNGFSKQYMDEGFNELIYQWDTCFMAAYGVYARHIFPVMPSIDNFYKKQRNDGYIQRIYRETTGKQVTEPTKEEPMVNPPLFAWIELRYYRITGDDSRLRRVLPVLINYFNWIDNNCVSPQKNGLFYTTLMGSGMDNLPRHDIEKGCWIDFSSQQALAAKSIAEIAKIINNKKIETEFTAKHHQITDSLNANCWDDSQLFYFDITKNDTLCRTKHIGAFWPLLAEIAVNNRDQLLVNSLLNPDEFWRPHLVPALSADDPYYQKKGHYWRGSVWAPTNYMLIKGLEKYGYYDLADDIALNHVKNVEHVYYFFKPNEQNIAFEERYADSYNTIWECYSAELKEPATRWDNIFYARQDFVGWSGLGPIAMLIENVLGIWIDGQHNSIKWRIQRQDIHGIENIQLCDQFVGLICRPYPKKLEIEVTAKKPFILKIEWIDKEYVREIKKVGKTIFEIK